MSPADAWAGTVGVMKMRSVVAFVVVLSFGFCGMLGRPTAALAQDLGGAGTIQGTVKDPTGGVMVSVAVNLSNAVTGLKREATTDAVGRFVFRNLPPNPYRLQVSAQGFQNLERTVDVRTSVPIDLTLSTMAVL